MTLRRRLQRLESRTSRGASREVVEALERRLVAAVAAGDHHCAAVVRTVMESPHGMGAFYATVDDPALLERFYPHE